MAETAILLLAAGNSSRLGRSKQLLQNKEGDNLLVSTINTALESQLGSVHVVLGANYTEHNASIPKNLDVTILNNKGWMKGMGSTLKYGLKSVMAATTASSLIVCVCDQPLLTSAHLKSLVQKHNSSRQPIVTSQYSNGAYGVPVLFSNSLFSKLLEINDDAGALNFVKQNEELMTTIDFQNGHLDVDTVEDVQRHDLR